MMLDAKRQTPWEALEANVQADPSAPALLTAEKVISRQEFRDETLCLAGGLTRAGLQKDGRVALAAKDYTEFFTLLYAVWAAGGIAAPMNITLPPANRAAILGQLKPDLCVKGSGLEGLAPESFSESFVTLESLRGDAIEPHPNRPEDEAMIMFTSGTTGVPKGVQNNHGALALNAGLMAGVLGLTEQDRIFINTPPYYTSAIIHLLTMFTHGAGLAAQSGFMFGGAILELMASFGCSGFGGAPVSLGRISEAGEDAPMPDGLRFLMSSGDHLPVPVIQKLTEGFPGVKIFTVYGLTEVAGRLCVLPPEDVIRKSGSVGRPLSGMTVGVFEQDSDTPCPPETLGEVCVRGPLLSKGYLNSGGPLPGADTPAGFRTGDFGYLDQDGFLFLRGRKDDIFKSGGEKVSTILIQQALSGMPEFLDCAVLPVEDAVLGRVPGVYYVPANGTPLKKRAVLKRLKQVLPPNHIPVRFSPLAKIPRTGSGKIIRRELEEMILAAEGEKP